MAYPYSGGTSIPINEPAAEPSTPPASLTISQRDAGLYTSAAGSVADAFADIAQGVLAQKRAKAIGQYNAEVAQANAVAQAYAAENEAQQALRNAQLVRQDIAQADQAQSYREDLEREQFARTLGQTRAIIASSGLMLSGSPLTVYEETARQQQQDILAQRYQTSLQTRALGEQAVQEEYRAELARYGAGERLRVGRQQAGLIRSGIDTTGAEAGVLRAGAALTKGAAWYDYQQARREQVATGQTKS